MDRAYAARELREQLERGTQPDEDFFRMKVTGQGETKWVNISPSMLGAIIERVEGGEG